MQIRINGVAGISSPKQKVMVENAMAQLGRSGADIQCDFADKTGSALIQVSGDAAELPGDWQRSVWLIATFSDTCNITYRREDDPSYRLTIKKDRFLDMPETIESCIGYEWHDPFHTQRGENL